MTAEKLLKRQMEILSKKSEKMPDGLMPDNLTDLTTAMISLSRELRAIERDREYAEERKTNAPSQKIRREGEGLMAVGELVTALQGAERGDKQ